MPRGGKRKGAGRRRTVDAARTLHTRAGPDVLTALAALVAATGVTESQAIRLAILAAAPQETT